MRLKSLKTNAILNVVKQSCTIIFPLITFPYVSRTLGETGFGQYSFAFSIVTYFSYIAALGVNTYAIREGAKIREDHSKLRQFCSEVFSISLLATTVSYVLLFIYLLLNTKAQEYRSYILILSLAMIIDAVGTDWVNSIFEDYFYITLRYIFFQVLSLLILFLFVHTENDVAWYCFVTLLAAHGGNLMNLYYVRKRIHFFPTIRMNFKKHIFPLLVLFFNSIAVVIYVNADITMLGYYYSDDVVGIYSFSSRIYNILKNIINAVVIVSLPRIAFLVKNNKTLMHSYLNKIFSGLTYIMIPAICGMFCMSKQIILLIGGDRYVLGDSSLRVLCIAILFAIYASFFSNCILIVNGKEKDCLISTVVSAIVNIVLNLFLLPREGIIAAAFTTLIAETLNFVIQLIYSFKVTSLQFLRVNEYISSIVGALGVVFSCMMVKVYFNGTRSLVVAITVSGVIYVAITLLLRNEIAILIVKTINGVVKKILNKKEN